MTKIGDTLYHFNVNRRRYTKPTEPGQIFGRLIYAEHFRPLKVIGETRVSWLLEHDYKAPKKGGGGFYTEQQRDDAIWLNEHRHRIREILDRATADQLREVAKILGYADGQLVQPEGK
jgi:hypothetical protein